LRILATTLRTCSIPRRDGGAAVEVSEVDSSDVVVDIPRVKTGRGTTIPCVVLPTNAADAVKPAVRESDLSITAPLRPRAEPRPTKAPDDVAVVAAARRNPAASVIESVAIAIVATR